jgi:hypothetical protein
MMINTRPMLRHDLDDQQWSAAPVVAATYDHLPDAGWSGFLRGRSPEVDRCRVRTGWPAERKR